MTRKEYTRFGSERTVIVQCLCGGLASQWTVARFVTRESLLEKIMTRRLTALITGASAGLGAEFARQLAASGCSLILVARRVERLQAIARQLQGEFGGVEVLCIEADLSRVDAPEHIRDQVSVHGWQVDYLINNAGASGPDFFGTEPWSEHLDYLRLMQTSVAELCHCFIPAMLERGFGRVINVSSVSGRIAAANNCPLRSDQDLSHSTVRSTGFVGQEARGARYRPMPWFTHTDFHATAGLYDLKQSTPRFMWYSAETVVREGLQAVEKGRLVCVSGRFYRWLDPLFQSVWTRWLLLRPE